MTSPSPHGSPAPVLASPEARGEVKAYLVRMVALVVLGIIIMASTAVWAWNRYAPRPEDIPPLPPGKPAFNNR